MHLRFHEIYVHPLQYYMSCSQALAFVHVSSFLSITPSIAEGCSNAGARDIKCCTGIMLSVRVLLHSRMACHLFSLLVAAFFNRVTVKLLIWLCPLTACGMVMM